MRRNLVLVRSSFENATPAYCGTEPGRCLTFSLLPEGEGPFVAPGSKSNLHDTSLNELADKLNTLIKETENLREDKKQTLGFMETDMGIVVVWKAELTESQKASISSADVIYDDRDNKPDAELAEILDLKWGRQEEG